MTDKIKKIIEEYKIVNVNNINLYTYADLENPRVMGDNELHGIIMDNWHNLITRQRTHIINLMMEQAPLKQTTKITRTLESLSEKSMKYLHIDDVTGNKIFGYKDARSKIIDGIWYVKPIAEDRIQYYIVCPICGDIHVHGKKAGQRLSQCQNSKLHAQYIIVV